MKQVFKRMLSLMIVLAMVVSMMPSVFAATTTDLSNLAVPDLGAQVTTQATKDGTATWTSGENSIKGSLVGAYTNAAVAHIYALSTTTMTFTNNMSSTAKLSFDYKVSTTSGYVKAKVGDLETTLSGSGTHTAELDSNGTLQIILGVEKRTKVGSNSPNDATIEITNIKLYIDQKITTTFLTATNGSYTVDGTSITAKTEKEKSASESYALVATPADGYSFAGWYCSDCNSYIAGEATATVTFEKAHTVQPLFISTADGIFGVGDARFSDLTVAARYAAVSTNKTVLLLKDTTITGSHNIPAGVTLLIPYSDTHTTPYCAVPESTTNAYTAPKVFRTMTLADGASISVSGAISLDAKHASANSGSWWGNGSPNGNYGHIVLDGNSAITVNSGGGFYAWGYVEGTGTVTAKNGAVVYENMQIMDFRGGSATLKMALSGNGVFPFSQYYVQNIESKLTLEYGAEEYIYTTVYMNEDVPAAVKFIGKSDAMFIPGENAYVTKQYLPDQDRMQLDVYGDMKLSSISMSVGGTPINSADYMLPINNNITINIHSGTTSITQDVLLQAGVELTIDSGATLDINEGADLFIFDETEWKAGTYVYTNTNDFIPVRDVPTRTYNRKTSDLKDVKLTVNGTLAVNGCIYTTASGANITSDGYGLVVFNNDAGTASTIKQYHNNSEYKDVSITAAQLRNADNTYVATAGATAGTAYMYVDGKWISEYSVTYDANGGTGDTMASEKVSILFVMLGSRLNDVTVADCSYTKANAEFNGWNTQADGKGTAYAAGDTLTVTSDVTLYAQWKDTTVYHNITWCDSEGNELCSEEIGENETPVYKGETPTKGYDATNHYTFAGWTTTKGGTTAETLTAVTQNTTYYAVFTAGEHNYTTEVAGSRTAATCVATGSVTMQCSCGATQVQTLAIDKTNHTKKNTTVKNASEASCGAEGYTGDTYCECGVKIADGEAIPATGNHNYTTEVEGTRVEPTCDDVGSVKKKCANCEAITTETLPRVAENHKWSETIDYEWSDDYETCTATRTCENNASHTESADATNVSSSETAATCSAKGCTTYKATFDEAWATEQTEKVDIEEDSTAHQWDTVSYEWATDNSSCTAIRVCKLNAKHTETQQVNTGSEVTKDPECEEKGTTTYTATFTVAWATTQTKYVDIDPTDHSWGNITYSWNDTFTSCTATRTCANDASHTQTAVTESISSNEHSATCEADGYITYTAVFEGYDWVNSTETQKDLVGTAGHTWGEVSYTWDEENGCSAKRVCTVDGEHEETIDAKVDYSQDDPSCTEPGLGTYTATFEADWAEEQTKKVTIEKLEHNWGEVQYLWSTDVNDVACVASRSCQRDSSHIEESTAISYTPDVTKEATCQETGTVVYTATFSETWAGETSESYELPIAKDNHVSENVTCVDNKDGTHNEYYECCDALKKAQSNHSYNADHVCACKAVEQITVKLSWNGTLMDDWTMTKEYGTKVSLTTGEVPEEHTFVGYAAEVGGEVVTTGEGLNEYTFTKNTTLYAVFKVNTYELEILYLPSEANEDGSYMYATKKVDVEYGADIAYTITTDGNVKVTVTYGNKVTEYDAGKASLVVDGSAYKGSYKVTDMALDVDNEYIESMKMPAGNAKLYLLSGFTGWRITDIGRLYQISSLTQKTGWTQIGENWYYLDPDTGYAATGVSRVPYPTHAINGVTYAPNQEDVNGEDKYGYTDATESYFIFDSETGVFQYGQNGKYMADLDTAEGNEMHWAVNGQLPWHVGLVQDGDAYYYFVGANTMATGDVYVSRNTTEREVVLGGVYTFGTDGKLCEYDGITKMADGTLRYYEDAQLMLGKGLVKIGDNYIYVRSNGALVVKNAYWVDGKIDGKSVITEGTYDFDENGFLINPKPANKNGIYKEDGVLYYYVNGQKTYAGLMLYTQGTLNGEESELYDGVWIYVKSNGQLAKGKYWATKITSEAAAADYDAGYYTFDENGIMDAVKNGIYDGHYYEDNVIVYNAGLIELNGSYYYVRSDGSVVMGQDYWITKTNDLLPSGMYSFGEDGKMIVGTEDGIVEVDGDLYYFVDGVQCIGSGLIQLETGEYIYVRSSGTLAQNCAYYVTNHNNLMPEGMYNFDENGYMVDPVEDDASGDSAKNGIVEEDGALYYYVDGELQYAAGLIQLETGEYIYVRSNGQLAVGEYWVTNDNGLSYAGKQTFGEDGIMII